MRNSVFCIRATYIGLFCWESVSCFCKSVRLDLFFTVNYGIMRCGMFGSSMAYQRYI